MTTVFVTTDRRHQSIHAEGGVDIQNDFQPSCHLCKKTFSDLNQYTGSIRMPVVFDTLQAFLWFDFRTDNYVLMQWNNYNVFSIDLRIMEFIQH